MDGQEILPCFLEWLQYIVATNDTILGSENEPQLQDLSI